MDTNKILNELKDAFGLKTETELANALGISTSGLANWRRRNTLDAHKVLASFPTVNGNWLLTGNGEILNTEQSVQYDQAETSKRLKEAVDDIKHNHKLTQKEVASKLGLKSPTYFSDVLNGRHPVSEQISDAIQNEFPEYSSNWILTGEGTMLIEQEHIDTKTDRSDLKHKHITGVQVNGNGTRINQYIYEDLRREIEEKNKVIHKFQEQIDRLITIIETRLSNYNEQQQE